MAVNVGFHQHLQYRFRQRPQKITVTGLLEKIGQCLLSSVIGWVLGA